MLLKKANLVRMGVAAAALTGAVTVASPAMAEVSASAAVASMYLWRGIDVGDGSAAVSGDLTYSNSGGYVGVWGSSGDSTLGSEYDLYLGYGGEVGGFSYDLSLWNYNYSDQGFNGAGFNTSDDTTGELSEVILTIGYGGVSFSYYDNIAGASGYEYYTLGGSLDKFSATVGFSDDGSGGPGENDYTHVNVAYAFNDNLSFTVSKIVDQDLDKNETVGGTIAVDEDVKFVVAYSLPITM